VLALGSACTAVPGTHCHELSRVRGELDGLLDEVDATGPVAEGDELDLATGDLLTGLSALARNDGDPKFGRAVHELTRAYDDFDRPVVRERLAEVRAQLDAKIQEDCLGG
jgi:hypothetical protein